jgi:hypothetical protein
MKKIMFAVIIAVGVSSPSYAWYDAYGGFTCGYMDPLTSFLDSIFGPPCPPPAPVAVVQAPPVVVERPVPVAVPQPVPVPVPVRGPCPVYGNWCW